MTPTHTHHGLHLCVRPIQWCNIASYLKMCAPCAASPAPTEPKAPAHPGVGGSKNAAHAPSPALIAQRLASKFAAHAPGPATEVKKPAAGVPAPAKPAATGRHLLASREIP